VKRGERTARNICELIAFKSLISEPLSNPLPVVTEASTTASFPVLGVLSRVRMVGSATMGSEFCDLYVYPFASLWLIFSLLSSDAFVRIVSLVIFVSLPFRAVTSVA